MKKWKEDRCTSVRNEKYINPWVGFMHRSLNIARKSIILWEWRMWF